MSALLFWLFALAACGGAVGVVIERNIVRMAFWLIVSLGSVSGLFFLLGADFLGATQLLVYVGGTIVLLIFGVMLTATGPLSRTMTATRSERLLASVIGASLLSVFGVSVLAVDWPAFTSNPSAYADGGTTRPLGLKLLGLDSERLRIEGRESQERDDTTSPSDRSTLNPQPSTLDFRLSTFDSTGYLLPFEIASVHLLVVLIGAAYLARAKRRRES